MNGNGCMYQEPESRCDSPAGWLVVNHTVDVDLTFCNKHLMEYLEGISVEKPHSITVRRLCTASGTGRRGHRRRGSQPQPSELLSDQQPEIITIPAGAGVVACPFCRGRGYITEEEKRLITTALVRLGEKK